MNDQFRAFPILKKYLHSTLSIKGELKKYRAAFLCGLLYPCPNLYIIAQRRERLSMSPVTFKGTFDNMIAISTTGAGAKKKTTKKA